LVNIYKVGGTGDPVYSPAVNKHKSGTLQIKSKRNPDDSPRLDFEAPRISAGLRDGLRSKK